MKIEVATKKDATKKDKGDLLENIAKAFMQTQSYDVVTNVGFTGTELDLLCKHKVSGKEIFVECKAYDIKNQIQSSAINKIFTTKGLKNYSEAWLIATSELGKEAKGLVEDIKKRPDGKDYVFYTPEKFIEALVTSSKIKSENVANEVFLKIVKDKNKLGKSVFFATEYGDFWAKEYLKGGKPTGALFAYANNAEIIKEEELLENLANLDTSFSNLDFNIIFALAEKDGEVIPRKISIDNLKLNSEYLSKINDLGIRITHPDKENLSLNDVFIYPDLEEITDEKNTDPLSSENLKNADSLYKKCFLLGEEVSGKTALSFQLQKDLNQIKFISLYINASDIKKSDLKSLDAILVRKFEQQYNNSPHYVKFFRNILEKSTDSIVLIIDDYDSLNIKRSEMQVEFLKTINSRFENIFIFGNKKLEIEVLAKSDMVEILKDFKIFNLKELGHLLRDKLVHKWITLNDEENFSDSEFYEKKDSITNKINIAVGTNFIPTYPLYILTMLQLTDDASKLKLQGSSYAELYRYLITQALGNASAKVEDFDFFNTYLSYVAYSCFRNRKKQLSQDEINSIFKEYCHEMELEKKFDSVHSILLKAKILKYEEKSYKFNHNYSYYFFVARYLADNINEQETIKDIKVITSKLYTNEFANIIIFLIHHTKDPLIIDRIVEESTNLFNYKTPFILSKEETNKTNSLLQEEIKFSLKESSPKDYRQKELREKDKAEESVKKTNKKEDYDLERELDLFAKINLSFKLIEIQGQIVKNYYGSLKSNKKTEILDEISKLGFRGLRIAMESFSEFQDAIKNDIQEKVKEKKLFSEGDIDRVLNKILFAFHTSLTSLFIKKVSDSIASRDLLLSIDKLEERNQNPAIQLTNIAVKLNFPNGLDKKSVLDLDKEFKDNFLAKSILRAFVIEHLYKFDVRFSEKQSICDNLGIDLVKSKKILATVSRNKK